MVEGIQDPTAWDMIRCFKTVTTMIAAAVEERYGWPGGASSGRYATIHPLPMSAGTSQAGRGLRGRPKEVPCRMLPRQKARGGG